MKELFLFVRPPRPLWPFNGPASGFWPPLAFASMAAALREAVRDLRVAILDAPALRMGWRSLEQEVRRLQPAYVGIGEEAVSCAEGLRLARLAKALGMKIIAGGCFFSHVAAEVIQTGWVDIVVHGEGEGTIVELVDALRSGERNDWSRVAGISFSKDGEIVHTPPRQLLPDLDRLPMPAYDLLPVDRYGHGSRNHPNLAAIELGRGCLGACGFCVLWRQMGHVQAARLAPHFRTKTAERLLEEIRRLVRQFGRRYLGWVDPCFNADSRVPGELAELLLRENIQVGQSAWIRADGIVRDAASGALSRCIRSGLNEVYIGIERPDPEGLQFLKKRVGLVETRQALHILTQHHPQVFTVGTFIYGLPGDTAAAMRSLYRFSIELGLDKTFFIPLTPLPGTAFWRPELWDPTGEFFRTFNFLPASSGNEFLLSLERVLLSSFALDWNVARIQGYVRGFLNRDSRKRRLTRHLFFRSLRFCLSRLHPVFRNGADDCGMIRPAWYES